MKIFSKFFSRVAALAVAAAVLSGPRAFGEEECGDYGTSVIFADSTAEAAKQAIKEEKLVFVLHVSGNFEVAEFT